MNDRIKLLAEQSTIKTSHKYHTWGDRIATETKEVFDKEKFAELIVRECALTAGLMEHEGRQGIGAQILDNFGVEE